MTMYLTREFEFSGGHRLTFRGRVEEHAHGHNYEVRVTLRGEPDEHGAVLDLQELGALVEEHAIRPLDGRYLNDVLENPTMERIAVWIWKRLEPKLPALYEVRVWENRKKGSSAIYRGRGE